MFVCGKVLEYFCYMSWGAGNKVPTVVAVGDYELSTGRASYRLTLGGRCLCDLMLFFRLTDQFRASQEYFYLFVHWM